METKKALITGITGQDGYYLNDFLAEKGYEVHGLVRKVVGRDETFLYKDPVLHTGDIRESRSLENLLWDEQFDEIYHLAAQSDVAYSFTHPQETYDINITGTLNLMNAVKEFSHYSKVYFAGTSELYGKPERKPQDERYPFKPVSPYAVSKLAGFYTVSTYRQAYDIFACSGILFNHESPLRGRNFVTQKIVKGLYPFTQLDYFNNHLPDPLELGNLDALKDWGHAKDYVRGMWMMLQHDKPDDYVLATGVQHTVREFLEATLDEYDIPYIHKGITLDDGSGQSLFGKEAYYTYKEPFLNSPKLIPMVTFNDKYKRPNEADNYMGDYSKAWHTLGWEPKITFEELIKDMVEAERIQ